MGKSKNYRIAATGIAVLLGIVLNSAGALAGDGLIEQLRQMGAAAPSVMPPFNATAASKTPKLGRFASSGTISATLVDFEPCPGSLEAQPGGVCATTPTDCDQLTIIGPVTATGLSGSNLLSACITLDNMPLSTNLSLCFNGIGTGTITADNGKNSLNLDLGGELCLANASPLVNPTAADFVFSGTYAITGGSGADASAVGSGAASFNDEIPSLLTSPLTGTGELQLTGNSAK